MSTKSTKSTKSELYRIVPNEPASAVIEALEGLLEEARRGEIRAIAWAIPGRHGWAFNGNQDAGHWIGSIEILKHELLNRRES